MPALWREDSGSNEHAVQVQLETSKAHPMEQYVILSWLIGAGTQNTSHQIVPILRETTNSSDKIMFYIIQNRIEEYLLVPTTS